MAKLTDKEKSSIFWLIIMGLLVLVGVPLTIVYFH